MADVPVAVQQITPGGLAPAYTGSLSTSNVYQVPNDGRTILHFKKANAVACTVTVNTPGTVGAAGLAIADLTGTVPASDANGLIMGPFAPGDFNQPGEGIIEFTLSNIDGLSVAALRI